MLTTRRFVCCLLSQSKSLLHDSSLNIFSPPSILKETINEMPHDKHIRSSTPVSSLLCSDQRRDRDVSGCLPVSCSSPSEIELVTVQCFNCANDRGSYDHSFCDSQFRRVTYENYLRFGCKFFPFVHFLAPAHRIPALRSPAQLKHKHNFLNQTPVSHIMLHVVLFEFSDPPAQAANGSQGVQQLADSGLWQDTGPGPSDGTGERFRSEETSFQSFAKYAERHVMRSDPRQNVGPQRMMFPIATPAAPTSGWARPSGGCSFPDSVITSLAPAAASTSISTTNYTYVCQNNIIVLNSEDGHNFYTNDRN